MADHDSDFDEEEGEQMTEEQKNTALI